MLRFRRTGWLGLALILAACSDDREPGSATTGAAHGIASDGHAKMVKRLAEIDRQAQIDNPYFGRAVIDEIQSSLASLAPAATKKRWRLNYVLGWNLMRLGRNQEAVECLEVARQLAPKIQAYLDSGQETNVRLIQFEFPIPSKATSFDLGMAYMRVAERSNCVAMHTSESCILPIEGTGVHKDQVPARKAIECFLDVLSKYPKDLTTRWLLNVAAMAVGDYPDKVPAEYRLPEHALDSDAPFPRFHDVAPDLGLNDMDEAGGAALDDFDGDGWIDVVTSSINTHTPVHLMHNNGDGSFVDRTDEAGLAGIFGGLNLIDGDYDNDGDLDLLVLRGAWWGTLGGHPNSLLRNSGTGTFTDVTYDAGLADPAYPTQTAGFADYDNDGDLDLYIGNEYQPEVRCPSQLFRNEGDGTFKDVARQAGVENERFAKGVTWGDYDGDRDPDLYVSNLFGDNRLYRNKGDGTFEDVAPTLGVVKPFRSFATWFFDFDNDGVLDIFVNSYWNHPGYVAATFFGEKTDAELSCLYRGDGRGGFESVAEKCNLKRATMPMGCNFGDLDNDGFPDVYLGTGYPNYEGIVPNFMYWNRGGKSFADVTTAGGFGHLQKGHAVAFGDLDDDGDQDVFEQMGGAFPGDGFGDVLFENPGFGNHWLKVRLVGKRSNRYGVGCRIRADVTEGGATRRIFTWVNTGASFGCNPLRKDIGLGKAEKVDVLEVYWPTSDTTQTFRDVAVDQCLEITEGAKEFRVVTLRPAPFRR